ncbi:hypothetical protein JZ751_029579 [Albula glossodonta]|uniref:Uncharacterized protein n=1 Tax=Albula glossodonta TaxID=121402 RepID=A0A8T2MWF2_9TELE|nr:hypothetical protein JZ751_029579 [Albula glossodonta]
MLPFQVLEQEAPVHANPHHEEDAGVQIDMEDVAAENVAQNDRQVTQEAQAELQAEHGREVVPLEQTHVAKTEEEAAKRGAFFLFRKTMTEARPPSSHAG